MNNFIKRALSGVIFAIVFVVCILYGKSSYTILFTIITGLALDEFQNILEEHNIASTNKMLNNIAGVYLFLATFLHITNNTSAIIFMPYIFSLIYILISELYQNSKKPIANWAYSFAGQMYIALPFALLNLLAFNNTPGGYSALLPISVFIFIWVNDSGAYLIGSLLHKKFPKQLSPRISPNKTWIGSIGGALAVLAVGAALYYITESKTLWFWFGMGFTVSIFGTYGDLIESQLKRQLGIKDSGKFLPGHGGVLDRFDSALLAIPAVVIYTYCFSIL